MPVGRLDMNSEGLLLLTNDGELKRRLELPATGWLRRYRVRVHGRVEEASSRRCEGIKIDGVALWRDPGHVDRVQGGNAWLTVALREGKNREIRRVLEHFGWPVNRLIRLRLRALSARRLRRTAPRKYPRKVLREQLGTLLAADAAPPRRGPARRAR